MILEFVYFGNHANKAIEEIMHQQGWSDETLGLMACQFIAEHGQGHNLVEYLESLVNKETESLGTR